MNQQVPQGPLNRLPDVPFHEKWEFLKPTIEQLYINENRKLSDVINAVNAQYGFDAAKHQYKHQIKKWKLRKNIANTKKAALCKTIEARAQSGKSTFAQYKGQDVDTNKLRRYLKMEARKDIALGSKVGGVVRDAGLLAVPVPKFGNRVFVNWNMPYEALRSSTAKAVDHLSPFGAATSTPSDIIVATPSPKPGAPSPTNAPSPMSRALIAKAANDRARLFVEGRHDDLLRSMEKQERVIMSTWLYQFWLYSFKTAKHWGRGPGDWTASMLRFDHYQERLTLSAANTPGTTIKTPTQRTDLRDDELNNDSPPSDLCRWSVHVAHVDYEGIRSPPPTPPANIDADNEQSWTEWPTPSGPSVFLEKLQDGLENNDFSNVRAEELPVTVTQIARAARSSPNELLKEAVSFSIMAGNAALTADLLWEIKDADVDISGLYPFHLATSYLGGSKTCCNILKEIGQSLFSSKLRASPRKLYVNDLGHTVLDNLMIAILKAHTSCVPSMIDHAFRKEKRFAGEEIDVCGRWDADSDCVRALLATGIPAIPFEWKHIFCHTSVQTICHCFETIAVIFGVIVVDTPSGLFLKRCSQCGQKLQLFPLHTLIVTAFHLAQHGCQDESLFGILACLLCLLGQGAKPLLKAHISGQALLTTEQPNECDHEELDPLELMDKVPISFTSAWSTEVIVGWKIMRHILQHSQAEWTRSSPRHSQRQSGPEQEDHDDEFGDFNAYRDDGMSVDDERSTDEQLPTICTTIDDHKWNFFGRSKVLATLWAAVQTELLTYRRLERGDSWISSNFNMHDLLASLDAGSKIRIGLVQKKMMKSFCDCGMFIEADNDLLVRVDEACTHYFSNLEDWNRSTYI